MRQERGNSAVQHAVESRSLFSFQARCSLHNLFTANLPVLSSSLWAATGQLYECLVSRETEDSG